MYKEKIDAYIDGKREEILRDLEKLVSINSQKGEAKEGMPFGEGPAAVVAEAEKMMKDYGFLTTNYDNYVVTGDFSEKEKALDILAHLDVVPVTEDWTVTKPFEMKIVGDRVYGRGTADDKGPALAALYAMRAIKDLGIPMKKSVRLILGSDEECGSSDLRYYYSREQEAPYSFTPDADFPLINIEKGHLNAEFGAEFPQEEAKARVLRMKSGDKANVVPQRAMAELEGVAEDVLRQTAEKVTEETGVKFTVSQEDGHWKVEARGQAAHASTPAEGKNALTATLRLISRLPLDETKGHTALMGLEKLMPYEDTCGTNLGIARENKESGPVTVCFSILDYTPEKLSALFDSRLALGCNDENTRIPVKNALAQYGIELTNGVVGEPHCVPGDSWFVKTLLDSYERYTGIKGEPLSTGGGTYVHGLERGVAFGCMMQGVDNHMHGDDEFMVIDTLLMSAKIFADAILKICNAE